MLVICQFSQLTETADEEKRDRKKQKFAKLKEKRASVATKMELDAPAAIQPEADGWCLEVFVVIRASENVQLAEPKRAAELLWSMYRSACKEQGIVLSELELCVSLKRSPFTWLQRGEFV